MNVSTKFEVSTFTQYEVIDGWTERQTDRHKLTAYTACAIV